MNNCKLASSGLAFTNSNSIVQGNFYKPDTVLDTIRMSKPTADGVIVITGKHASGRIGVSSNCLIVGAIVDGSGETGIGAVYKLLLVPYGTFNFRQQLPQEQWHIQQDLNLHVHDLKASLAGPASIGLARPADISLTNLTAATPVQNTFVPNIPNFENSFQHTNVWISNHSKSNDETLVASGTSIILNALAPDAEKEEIFEEYVQSRRIIRIKNYEQSVSNTFVADCDKLLDAVDKKQTVEIVKARSGRTTDPNLRALNVVPEPTTKSTTFKPLVSAVIIAGVMGLIALVGFVSHSQSSTSNTVTTIDSTADFMATVNAKSANAAAAKEDLRITSNSDTSPDLSATVIKQSPIFSIANSNSEQPSPDHTTFILPGAGPINSSAPAADNSQPTKTATDATLNSLLAKNVVVESENLSFWVQAVRKNPNDAIAREHLAYKLLAHGQPKVSVQQFQALMVLRQPGTEEISKYADALVLYDQKPLAQQFLTYAMSADPSKVELRQKLAAIQ
ncbi:MAG: hypothetical protein SGJ27_23485 [Candidatus Melainabacteria bacterium]|nr:hypothetical protein [Candidatus Melainabacteria bacterium]